METASRSCPYCGYHVLPEDRTCGACYRVVDSPDVAAGLMRRPPLDSALTAFHGMTGLMLLGLSLMFGAVAVGTVRLVGLDSEPLLSASLAGLSALLLLLVGGVELACAVGLGLRKRFGRTLQLVFAYVGLIGFPVGTAFSVLLIYYFNRPGVVLLYSGRPQSELDEGERQEVRQLLEAVPWRILAAFVWLAALVLTASLFLITPMGMDLVRTLLSGA